VGLRPNGGQDRGQGREGGEIPFGGAGRARLRRRLRGVSEVPDRREPPARRAALSTGAPRRGAGSRWPASGRLVAGSGGAAARATPADSGEVRRETGPGPRAP